jgi:hypothetical protein
MAEDDTSTGKGSAPVKSGKEKVPNPNAPIDSKPVGVDPIFEGQGQIPNPPEHPMSDHPGSPKTPHSAGNTSPGYLKEVVESAD